MISYDEACALGYRWWTCRVWLDDDVGLKLGPLSLFAYRFDGEWRLAWTWYCGPEHFLWRKLC